MKKSHQLICVKTAVLPKLALLNAPDQKSLTMMRIIALLNLFLLKKHKENRMNEREAFEKWFRDFLVSGGYATNEEATIYLKWVDSRGGYIHESTNLRWQGYQAALASQEPVRYMVQRFSEGDHEKDEYFDTPEKAYENARWGLNETRVTPLYTSPQAQSDLQDAERARIDHIRQLAYWQVLVKHNLTDEAEEAMKAQGEQK
jgi:hypothetical protein